MPSTMLPGIGIFGTEPLARNMVAILKVCGFKVTAVWSRSLKDAESFAEEMDIPFHTNNMDGLLLRPEVQCIVVACTPHFQSHIAGKAMGIGKHVIATWPAGTNQLETLRMVKGALYYPSLFTMMCHGLRFLPAYITMRHHLNAGRIGKPYLFEVKVHCQSQRESYSWRCDSLMGGGALSLHGSYIIDIITYLTGRKAKSVHGMMKTYSKDLDGVHGVREITCDDFCTFQLELEDGITVSCTINTHMTGCSSHEVVAIGSKGRMVVRDLDLYLRLNEDDEDVVLHTEPRRIKEKEIHTVQIKDNKYKEAGRVPFMAGKRVALTNHIISTMLLVY